MATNATCLEAVQHYIGTLESEMRVSQVEASRCVLLTPFMRPDGDFVAIELVPQAEHILISDMGETLAYLNVNGLTLTNPTMDTVRQIAFTFGVSLIQSELEVRATPDSIGSSLNLLLQAAVAVSGLIYRKRPGEPPLFDVEVEGFLAKLAVPYDNDYEVAGARETHHLRFHVDTGRRTLIQPITANNESVARSWSERWAYRFGDIRQARGDWNLFAVLDDRADRKDYWTDHATTPLRGQATIVLWAEQERLSAALRG